MLNTTLPLQLFKTADIQSPSFPNFIKLIVLRRVAEGGEGLYFPILPPSSAAHTFAKCI
jgi:hypothetical protein